MASSKNLNDSDLHIIDTLNQTISKLNQTSKLPPLSTLSLSHSIDLELTKMMTSLSIGSGDQLHANRSQIVKSSNKLIISAPRIEEDIVSDDQIMSNVMWDSIRVGCGIEFDQI